MVNFIKKIKSLLIILFFLFFLTSPVYALPEFLKVPIKPKGEIEEKQFFQAEGSFNIESILNKQEKAIWSQEDSDTDIVYVKASLSGNKKNSFLLEVDQDGQVSGTGVIDNLQWQWQEIETTCWSDGSCSTSTYDYVDIYTYNFVFSGELKGKELSGSVNADITQKLNNKVFGGGFSQEKWQARKIKNIIEGEVLLPYDKEVPLGTIEFRGEVKKQGLLVEPSPTESPEPEKLSQEEKKSLKERIKERMRSMDLMEMGKLLLQGEENWTDEEKRLFILQVLGIDVKGYKENIGRGKKAYIIYSPSICGRRRLWLDLLTKQTVAAEMFFKLLGYDVKIITAKDTDQVFDYMVDPQAAAVAYFAHQGYCSIEESRLDDLGNFYYQALTRYFMKKKNYDSKRARQEAKKRGTDSLDKDIFINFSCHSLDKPEIIKKTVRPGGIYYGHKGTLWPTEGLKEKIRK